MRRERKEAAIEDLGDSYQVPRVHKDHWIRVMTRNRRRRHATRCTRSMQQLQDAEPHQFIRNNKSDKGLTSSLNVTKRTRIDLIHLGGGTMFPRQCILHLLLRHPGGKSQTAGGRGTGQLYHGVNSDLFSFQMKYFACRKFNLLAFDGEREV